MASEDETTAGRDSAQTEGAAGDTEGAAAPVPCSACRGSGHVISHLGGQRSVVECPWCDGGGVRLADHDAQARRRTERGDAPGGPTGQAKPDNGPDDAGPGGDQAA